MVAGVFVGVAVLLLIVVAAVRVMREDPLRPRRSRGGLLGNSEGPTHHDGGAADGSVGGVD